MHIENNGNTIQYLVINSDTHRGKVLVDYNTTCPLYTTLLLISHDGWPSLDVELKVLNVHVLIAPGLITAQPDLNIVSSWLGKVLTEPGALVTACLKSSWAAQAIPQPIIVGVVVSTFILTAVVITNEWR